MEQYGCHKNNFKGLTKMKYLPISIVLGFAWSITALSADANILSASNTNSKKVEQSNNSIKLAQNSNRNSQVWKITRQNTTYQIKIQQHNGNFNASYNNINNDSIFTGKFLTGRGNTLINFVQEDDNGYYAVHSGIMINGDLFEGRWYDSSGNTGTFKLYK